MSDTPPDPPASDSPASEPRRLTRSARDAVIGGVAGGLGRHFGTDPILFRIAFVVLAFAGGIGVLLYLALLAFVPLDEPSGDGGPRQAVAVAGAVALGVALVVLIDVPGLFFGPGLFVLAITALGAYALWRAIGRDAGGDPARAVARAVVLALLALLALGAAIAVGVVAALGGGTAIAVLAVVAGLALVGAAFAGGRRRLILPALVLVLPLAFVAAADLRLDGGVGERDHRPSGLWELRERYEIGIGELLVDLRDVDLPAGRTDLAVDVGVGEAVVYVPHDVCVTSDVTIGIGASDVLDRDNAGVDVLVADGVSAPAGRPQLHLDADVGVGAVEVVREGFARDGFHRRSGAPPFGFFHDDDLATAEERSGCA